MTFSLNDLIWFSHTIHIIGKCCTNFQMTLCPMNIFIPKLIGKMFWSACSISWAVSKSPPGDIQFAVVAQTIGAVALFSLLSSFINNRE